MTTPDPECCTPYLKALGDKTRWRVVRELLSSPLTVSELARRLQVTQYNISKHLRVLRQAGMVETVRLGKHVHCRVVPAIERRAANNKKQLDLGCCVFRFEKSPR